MTRDRNEDRIQDYLDGRLSGAERADFEARLRQDPELARRLDDYRKIGQALREEEPVLSPGFYTRARARFEAASGRPRRAFRLLSWEAAGLSAAVLLAAAIFLPGLLRQDETVAPPPSPTEPAPESRADDREAAVDDGRMLDESAPAQEDAPEEAVEEGFFAPAPPPAKPEAKREVDKKGRVDDAIADAPPPAAEAAGAEPRYEEEKAATRRQRESAPPAAKLLSVRQKAPIPVAEIVALAPGTLEPGTVRVTDEGEWQAPVPAEPQAGEKRFADRDQSRRIVLIGARPGLLDCSAVTVESVEDALIVRVPSEGAGEPGPDCAVFLPLDDREIRVLGTGGDD